jgi:competence protein ComEA
MQAKKETPLNRFRAFSRQIVSSAEQLTGFQVVVIGGLLLVLITGGVVTYVRSRPREVTVKQATSPMDGKKRLSVHVAGAVSRPGLYRMSEGSRVDDALKAAGGPSPGAALDQINLAERLKDGQKVLVPATEPAPEQAAAAAQAAPDGSAGTLVNINTATAGELDVLPGIGPSFAERIVDYREKNGAFSSVDELEDVPGIGPRKLEALRDLVTI